MPQAPSKKAAPSRTQQQRPTGESIHEEIPISFEEEGNLPKVPAKEGVVYRWIRVEIRSEDDRRNVYNAMRKGWTPVPADSLPPSLQWLATNREGLGNVVGTHDMVLMERAENIDAQENKLKQQKRKSHMASVKENMFNAHRDIGGRDSGFTEPVLESASSVEKGSPVRIQQD